MIYFPSAKEPTKLVPFPFFTFDEASLKKVAIERLLIGMDIGSYKGEFLNIPSGRRIVSLKEEKGDVTLTLSKEFSKDEQNESADIFAGAIATTLSQFKGVSAVHIMIEGEKSQLNIKVDESTIMTPGLPRLLSVTAMRDKGAKNIEEVNAFFDRPVDVKELKLLSNDGQQFTGELFHSVFDMAAVLKPKDTSQFKEGMPIQVRWKVVDKLGRTSEGNSLWHLEVKMHEK